MPRQPGQGPSQDDWITEMIACKGGIKQTENTLVQGLQDTGSASYLDNYEPSIDGAGYSRILGFQKWDSHIVPGTGPVLGVKPALSGVFACRQSNTGSNDIFYTVGVGNPGWGTRVNTVDRPANGTNKCRFLFYSITKPVIIQLDGVNPACKWDGTTFTTINGTGAPADPKYGAMFLNSLVLAGYSANTSNISISAPDNDTDFNGINNAVEINVGDIVVGLRTFRGTLYIFCQRNIYQLTGTSVANFLLSPVTNSLGCISGDTIQEIGGDLLYISAEGVRSLAATTRIGDVDLSLLSSNITPTLTNDIIGDFMPDAYSTCVVHNKSQYRIFIYSPEFTDSNAIGAIGRLQSVDFQNGLYKGNYAWTFLHGFNVFCADSEYQPGGSEVIVFGHPSNGFVYQMEQGNSFDGNNIIASYLTPPIVLKDPSYRKVLQKLSVLINVQSNLSLIVQPLLDFGNEPTLQPASITMPVAAAISLYGTAIYGTDVYSLPAFSKITTNLVGSGKVVQFEFMSSSDSAPPHRIDTLILEYSIKGRR